MTSSSLVDPLTAIGTPCNASLSPPTLPPLLPLQPTAAGSNPMIAWGRVVGLAAGASSALDQALVVAAV